MNHVAILAAGNSDRSGLSHKLYENIGGKPLFYHAIKAFYVHPEITSVVVVIREVDRIRMQAFLEEEGLGRVELVLGGLTRQESAEAAYRYLKSENRFFENDFFVVHNAANPFVTADEITAVLVAAQKEGAACAAHAVVDTLKRVEAGKIIETVDRSKMWRAQTPQVVRTDLYAKALEQKRESTDEMSLVEVLGIFPSIVPAGENNIKITTRRDIEFARFLLENREIHTGIGMDSHRFEREHRGLTLGGKYFPDAPKCQANSDGDVMLHALCNAIFQAIGEGSLGTFADALYEEQGVQDSTVYLNHVLTQMKKEGYAVEQVGFQLEGATPRIDPISADLKAGLAALLGISTVQIGITATTGEDLTPFGRGEGLQCWATVTLSRATVIHPR